MKFSQLSEKGQEIVNRIYSIMLGLKISKGEIYQEQQTGCDYSVSYSLYQSNLAKLKKLENGTDSQTEGLSEEQINGYFTIANAILDCKNSDVNVDIRFEEPNWEKLENDKNLKILKPETYSIENHQNFFKNSLNSATKQNLDKDLVTSSRHSCIIL